MQVKIDKKEMLILAVILVMCGWLYIIAADFPEASRRYPQMILIATGALATAEMALKSIKKNKEIDEQKIDSKKSYAVLFRVLTVMVMCVVYVILVGLLGFFSSTAIFSIGLMYYLGVRKPVTFIAVTLGLNLGVYLLFVTFLRISMPQGVLF